MSNLRQIPFTEIVERVQDLTRSNTDTKKRIRGIVNEIYTRDIPGEYNWYWLRNGSAITCIAEHDSGTVSVTTEGVTCTFSGTTIGTDVLARKIKFDGVDYVYDFTYSDSTGGTINPPLGGTANVTTGGYKIFKSVYSLPSDYERFVGKGLIFYQAGQPRTVDLIDDTDYYGEATASPSSIPDYCRMVGYDTAGALQIEIVPPPSTSYVLLNEYYKILSPLRETTAGTIVFGSDSTVVSGTDTLFTSAQTGDYIRATGFGAGADSVWYRITAITSDTSMTIATAFRNDSSYSGSYAICSIPQMPYQFHNAILYGAVKKILPDEKDPMLLVAAREYAKIMSDNKLQEQRKFAEDSINILAEDSEYRR